MKKILLFLVILLLPATCVNASSISSKAIGTSDITSTPSYQVSNGYFYATSLFSNMVTVGNHVYNLNDFSVEGYTNLIFSTLFYISTQDVITQEFFGSECKENGGCWQYSTNLPFFYSQIQMPQIAVLYDNALWVNCNINNVNYGLQSVSCEIPKGYKKLTSIRIRYNLNFNTNSGGQVITGVGNLMNLVYSTEQELIDAVKDDSQSQAQIDAINNASQNQIDAANKNSQAEIDATNKNTEATKDQTDFLKDDTAPDSDISVLGNVSGVLPPGPLDSLLNIPFKFLSVLTSSFSGTCVPISGTWVFDQTLTIPCFSEIFYDNVPAILMTFIDLVPATFLLIKYLKYLYKKVDRAASMESNSDDEWGVI